MLISVIIPVYNSENTVEKSIISVINSINKITEKYEIICVDDGSTDGSLEILQRLQSENHNIVVIHKENAGAATARNIGLNIAQGDYIAFNDSDDVWLENHFGDLLSVFKKHPEIKCVSGNHDFLKQKVIKLKKLDEDLYEVTLKNELIKNYYSPPATMLKKEIILDGIRFKEGMRYAEEGYFFYTIVYKYRSAFYNRKNAESITGKNKFGESGLSGNLSAMEKGELSNLKYAHKELEIGLIMYWFMVVFSLLKYFRRKIIVLLRKNKR